MRRCHDAWHRIFHAHTLSRRFFMKQSLLAMAVAAVIAANAHADATLVNGPMGFDPIAASAYGMENDADIATTPWVIPEGFTQSIVSDETDLNIYVSQRLARHEHGQRDPDARRPLSVPHARSAWRCRRHRRQFRPQRRRQRRCGLGGRPEDRRGAGGRRACRLGSTRRSRLDAVAHPAVRRGGRHFGASRPGCPWRHRRPAVRAEARSRRIR